jgi:hypothetical protein
LRRDAKPVIHAVTPDVVKRSGRINDFVRRKKYIVASVGAREK